MRAPRALAKGRASAQRAWGLARGRASAQRAWGLARGRAKERLSLPVPFALHMIRRLALQEGLRLFLVVLAPVPGWSRAGLARGRVNSNILKQRSLARGRDIK